MNETKDSRPTIYDVAALSGTSISTVSRVLNSSERVSKEAREKVLAAIDDLGFVPKAEARARALQSTRRIGVLTPFFTAPSFVQRLRGIDTAMMRINNELIIYTVDSLTSLEGYLAVLPLGSSLEGLIVISLPIDGQSAHRLVKHGLEAVSIEYTAPSISSVEIDDYGGGKMAARYLVSKGHRSCGFVGDLDPPDYAVRPVIRRLEGYRAGLQEAGFDLPDEYIRSSPYRQVPTRQAAHELLSLPKPPTAIFAAADIQAIVIWKIARELGLHIPGDLAIIGFDDLDMADYIGLTTIRQPLDDSGRLAAELLLTRMADSSRPFQHIQLPLTIVERETV